MNSQEDKHTYSAAIVAQVYCNRSIQPHTVLAMAGSSVDKHVVPDVEMEESGVDKPAKDPGDLVVAWYNITWERGQINSARYERLLQRDLQFAFRVIEADIVLLSECGEIDEGLPEKRWLAMLRDICGNDCDITHHSHYTAIVKKTTVTVIEGPMLSGPMTSLPNHRYRKCQYLQVKPK